MKIRSKLVLLVFGITTLMSAGTALFIVRSNFFGQMQKDKSVLVQLSTAVEQLSIATNRLPYEPFRDKLTVVDAAAEAVNSTFAALDDVHSIATIGEDVVSALGAIRSLKELADTRLATLRDKYKPLLADAAQVFLFVGERKILDFYTYDVSAAKQQYLVQRALPDVLSFLASLETMNDTLRRSIKTIDEQFLLIDSAVLAATNQATLSTAAILLLILILTLVGALILANGLATAVISVERHISVLKDGDLTKRSVLARRDEIGTLSMNLNQFMDALALSLREIQVVSHSNLIMKNSVVESTGDATAAITQIGANTRSMESQIRSLDQKIAQSVELVGQIGHNIGDLDRKIGEQLEVNDRSSASVLGMVKSLDQMRTTTQKELESVKDLVQVSETGRVIFEEANRKINEIPQSIGAILEMAAVIDQLAAQTNLLAMNAAIEAAHAGNAGKGFAVVSEEIRKLAEASTDSSRHISASIKVVVTTIDEASKANEATRSAFETIDSKVQSVSRSLDQIHSSLSSIQTGSQQVLDLIADLKNRSESVGRSSGRVGEASGQIQAAMGDVGRISSEVTTNISEIVQGIGSIGTSIQRVSEMTSVLGEGSAHLDEEVHRFRLSQEGPSA